MLKIATPEDLLDSQAEEFNKGNIGFLTTIYEKDACFAFEPGHVASDLESIRKTLQGVIDMGAKLEAKTKRVIQANDLALLITKWSITGNGHDDKLINLLIGRGTIVLRRQPDGSWLMVIENSWGTE